MPNYKVNHKEKTRFWKVMTRKRESGLDRGSLRRPEWWVKSRFDLGPSLGPKNPDIRGSFNSKPDILFVPDANRANHDITPDSEAAIQFQNLRRSNCERDGRLDAESDLIAIDAEDAQSNSITNDYLLAPLTREDKHS
jgi:hypothetical protein